MATKTVVRPQRCESCRKRPPTRLRKIGGLKWWICDGCALTAK